MNDFHYTDPRGKRSGPFTEAELKFLASRGLLEPDGRVELAGANLTVAFATDAGVLGGLRVDMKNTVIDLSATTRLVEVLATARMA